MVWVCILVISIAVILWKALWWGLHIKHEVNWTTRSTGKRNGYIYYFRGKREPIWLVKIGRSNDPIARLRAHRTANPYGVHILAVFRTRDDVKAETFLHDLFDRERIQRHNEWFYMTPRIWWSSIFLADKKLTRRVRAAL